MMKKLMETFNQHLLSSNLGDEEDRICLDKEAFDMMIDMLSNQYQEYASKALQEGNECIPFERWLKISNAFNLASKGNLNK